jgi:uncharacterized membrane protein
LDSGDKDKYSSLRFFLFSHHTKENLHRTLHLKIHGKDMYLCARCFGIFVGLTISILFRQPLTTIVLQNPLIILILPAPAMTDWVTQTIRLRESSNPIRIATGSLLGVCWANMLNLFLIDWSHKAFWLTTILYLTIFLAVLPIRLKQASDEPPRLNRKDI